MIDAKPINIEPLKIKDSPPMCIRARKSQMFGLMRWMFTPENGAGFEAIGS